MADIYANIYRVLDQLSLLAKNLESAVICGASVFVFLSGAFAIPSGCTNFLWLRDVARESRYSQRYRDVITRGFLSNPVVLSVVGIGAIGYTVYEMISDKKEDPDNGSEAVTDGSEPFDDPLDGDFTTVGETVNEPLETVEATVNSSVEEPCVSTAPSGSIIELQEAPPSVGRL